MSEHTPGPWCFFPGGDSGDESFGVPPDPDMIAHYYNEPSRAFVCIATLASPSYWDRDSGKHIWTGELRANGNLIAAAPDLLAACETALVMIQVLGGDHMAGFEKIESAVSKAKGG